MKPGWKKGWYVGVRATQSRRLVASICGVPTKTNIRGQSLTVAEINFLCIHKKLRSKRLAPLLIREVTRRCCLDGIYQAIYTGKDILSTPIGTCQSYHRPLDWLKLYETGFISPPSGTSSKTRETAKYKLPTSTSTPQLRPMEKGDIDSVWRLLTKYLQRFQLYPEFSRDDIGLWLHATDINEEQVVWSYVVERPETREITDFVSFYSVDANILSSSKHRDIRMAYLYYYASETAFNGGRLQMLINDTLILAKNVGSSAPILPRNEYADEILYRLGLMSSTRLPSMITPIFLSD